MKNYSKDKIVVNRMERKTLDGIITRTETRGMSVPVYGLENTGRSFIFIL